MDGSQFPNGSYQSGNMESPGMGQQSLGDGQAGSGYGGYRRVSSPPGLEHRMSPPMQYIPGSFQPPQMFQRSQQQPPYGPPAHDSGKGFNPSKMYRKASNMMNLVPWRPLCLLLLLLCIYLYLQTDSNVSYSASSSNTSIESGKSFDELKSSVSQMTISSGTAESEEEKEDLSLAEAEQAQPEDPADSPLAKLREFKVEPDSLDVDAILAHPCANRVIVSEKAKVMYCPIPKAANSNWKLMIRKHEGFEDFEDLALAHDKNRNGLKYANHYSKDDLKRLLEDKSILKFTFARDPLSRTLSCYLNKFVNKEKDSDEYKEFMAQLYDWNYIEMHDIVTEERPSFEEFVNQIQNKPNEEMNEHWAPQSFLCGIGLFPYDFVGKLEDVETYAPPIIEWISSGKENHFPTQDEIRFPSGGTKDSIEQYYTDDIKNKVKSTFKDDFAMLGYK